MDFSTCDYAGGHRLVDHFDVTVTDLDLSDDDLRASLTADGGGLDAATRDYLDRNANQDGRFDVGDLLLYKRRKEGRILTIVPGRSQ